MKIKVQANQLFDLVRESIIEGAKRRKQKCHIEFFSTTPYRLTIRVDISTSTVCTVHTYQAVGFERESIRSLVKVAGR